MMHAAVPTRFTPAPAVLQRDCGCGGSCASCQDEKAQGHVRLGPRDDAYEREADHVADQVVGGGPAAIQRQTGEDDDIRMQEEEEEALQMKSSGPAQGAAVPAAAHAVASGGRPLGASERAYFEPRFGRDLGHVRLHTDEPAARGIGARAYTLRNHIAFAPGQFDATSTEGRRLIVHELTHTVQQGAGTIRRDCEEDQRKCRNSLNWSDGGHWQGLGPEPDCNCDNTFADSRAACHNSLNWSDGGHWIGSGSEPDCSLRQTRERSFTLTYVFPSNECVQKYYTGRNEIATHVSTGAGVIVGAGALAATRNPAIAESASATTTVGIAGIVLGAATNEALGGMAQTTIGVGYRWRRHFTVSYTRSAHPWGVEGASWSMTSEVTDENGDLVNGMSFAGAFSDDQLSAIGQLIPRMTNSNRTVTCPDANVLSM